MEPDAHSLQQDGRKILVTYRPSPPIVGATPYRVPPSPDELKVWEGIQSHFRELVSMAIASIPDPPSADISFDRQSLKLREIRIEPSDTFDFFFDPELIVEDYECCPVVTFKNWKIVEAYWTV